LIKIENQTRVYGTNWRVSQSNLYQVGDKLIAIRKNLPSKVTESKVRFSDWSTSQRGGYSQSEGLTSEESSPSASKDAQKGLFWEKRKSWRNIPQTHKEQTESKDSKKLDTRPYWVSGGADYRSRTALQSRLESGWITPRDRQVPVVGAETCPRRPYPPYLILLGAEFPFQRGRQFWYALFVIKSENVFPTCISHDLKGQK